VSWVTYAAIFFIVWWVTFFAVLPFGLRTQDEEKDVTLGTVPSAPSGPHMRRAVLMTTVIALVICATAYGLIQAFDLGLDDLPRLVPER
jgi:predicted secreted protein